MRKNYCVEHCYEPAPTDVCELLDIKVGVLESDIAHWIARVGCRVAAPPIVGGDTISMRNKWSRFFNGGTPALNLLARDTALGVASTRYRRVIAENIRVSPQSWQTS